MLNKAIIGKKVGMTQIFNADGKVIPLHRNRSRSLRCNSAQDRRGRTATMLYSSVLRMLRKLA